MRWLFTAGDDNKGQLLDIARKSVVRNYNLLPAHRYATAYCPNTGCVAIHQANHSVFFFSPHSQQAQQRSFTTEEVSCCAVSSCGTFMIAGTVKGNLLVWNLKSGQLLRNCRAHLRCIQNICLTADDAMVCTASDDSLLHVWSLASLVSLRGADVVCAATFSGHTLAVKSCATLHLSSCALTASADKTCCLVELSSGKMMRQFAVGEVLTCVAVSGDDEWMVAGTEKGGLYFNRLHAPTPTTTTSSSSSSARRHDPIVREPSADGHSSPIIFLEFSREQPQRVLSVSASGVCLWYDATNGAIIDVFSLKLSHGLLRSCCSVEASREEVQMTCSSLSKNPMDSSFSTYAVSCSEAAANNNSRNNNSNNNGGGRGLKLLVKRAREETAADEEARAELDLVLANNAKMRAMKEKLEKKRAKIAIIG